MSKLDEIRARGIKRPEGTVPLCLDGSLARAWREADEELRRLRAEMEAAPTDRQKQTYAEPIEKAAEAADAARDAMAEASGDLLLRAISAQEWRSWRISHPPRDVDDDKPAAARDFMFAGGYVNSDDLANALERWVVSFDGDELKPGDWEAILDGVSSGDIGEACRKVVTLQEEHTELPKAPPSPSTPQTSDSFD